MNYKAANHTYNFAFHNYKDAIRNSPSIKTLVLRSNSPYKIPQHLLKQISKKCQLNSLDLFVNVEAVVTPESLNQLLRKQNNTLETIKMRTGPSKDIEKFLNITWSIPSATNQEAISFKRLKFLSIDMTIMQNFINHGYSFLTVTDLDLWINYPSKEQPYAGLAENLKRVFPKLKHLKLNEDWRNSIQATEIEELEKIADIIDEIFLHHVNLKLTLGLIQNFAKANNIYLDNGTNRNPPEFPMRNPELLLANLVSLQIVASKGRITFSEYLAFFKFCPNLKVFNMLLRYIDGYENSLFIQKIREGRIGKSIQEFGLFLPNICLTKDLLHVMIKHWPCLQIINDIQRVTANRPVDAASLQDLANSLQMKAYMNTMSTIVDMHRELFFRKPFIR